MNVYIDGENLRHSLKHILVEEKLIKKSEDFFKFDILELLIECLGTKQLRIVYYTTHIRKPNHKVPKNLTKQIEHIQLENRKWLAQLSNQDFGIIKAGYLKVRENAECIKCGTTTLVMQEKGVDVRLAVDVVLQAAKKRTKQLVLVSSDSDIIPAIDAAKAKGMGITYFCFSEQLNRAMVWAADQTITYTRQQVVDNFRGSNGK